MEFGVCGVPSVAPVAASAGFDYIECRVDSWLKTRETEQSFRAALAEHRFVELPCPVLNVFLPGNDLKITGPVVDELAIEKFLIMSLERAERAGVEIIVFGSQGARNIPDGFDAERAHEQLVKFCSVAAPIADRHGVTIVLEPLCEMGGSNVLVTVNECAALVREVGHPGLRLLVDSYHFMQQNDSYQDIVKHGDLIAHVHIATIPHRLCPGKEPCDFDPFFKALSLAGYTGRVSIETREGNPPGVDLSAAISLLRKYQNA